MFTIIKAMEQVTGSEIILIGSILSGVFFTLVFISFKVNRNKKAITIYLITLFLIFEISDVIWLSYFFPQGEYINHGLAPMGIFLIFPFLCIILNIFYTIINYKNTAFN